MGLMAKCELRVSGNSIKKSHHLVNWVSCMHCCMVDEFREMLYVLHEVQRLYVT